MSMGFIGGGMYDVEYCPKCGCLMWNGLCENHECEYHWHPKEGDELVNPEAAAAFGLFGKENMKRSYEI